MTDHDLLRQYAKDRSELAFAELVRRHAEWVRASAGRQVRDPHLAEDVTQAVFLVLAEKAGSVGEERPLAPWLFGVLRLVGRRALRNEQRRRNHERQAAEDALARGAAIAGGSSTSPDEAALTEEEWTEVSRVLDESVAALPARDRGAVLLRFYQRKSFAEVGAALGGVSEEAARKCVTRAVERLRMRLARSGLALSGGKLTPALWLFVTPSTESAGAGAASNIASAASAAVRGVLTTGRPLALAKGTMTMATYSAMRISAACVAMAAAVAGFAMLSRDAAPAGTTVIFPSTRTVSAMAAVPSSIPVTAPALTPPAATSAAPESPPPPPQKSILDHKVPGISSKGPVAAEDMLALLQDMASVTITVEWEKLGARGDKGISINVGPMPLRDTLTIILKAAGAKKPARMTVKGTKVLVTAVPAEQDKK